MSASSASGTAVRPYATRYVDEPNVRCSRALRPHRSPACAAGHATHALAQMWAVIHDCAMGLDGMRKSITHMGCNTALRGIILMDTFRPNGTRQAQPGDSKNLPKQMITGARGGLD